MNDSIVACVGPFVHAWQYDCRTVYVYACVDVSLRPMGLGTYACVHVCVHAYNEGECPCDNVRG